MNPGCIALVVAMLSAAEILVAQEVKPTERSGIGGSAAKRYPEHVERWAVVIGVSAYRDEKIKDLSYAHRDAEEVAKLIQTPGGGGFAAKNVLMLTNERATTREITRALRGFLKKPAREDIVFIYFAGHGAPDPDRPSNLYLLTHDTEAGDIAGTALPMRELELSVRENLIAERVVIMADACHSAGVSGGRRSNDNQAEVLNQYLHAVAGAKAGLAVLTSAEGTQTAQEDARWGGGHGVFTHFLLEGMRGAADGFEQSHGRDGRVTVGELFEFVRAKVKEETNGAQHPRIGPSTFDREMPLAVTAHLAADDHMKLGFKLRDLGLQLNDAGRLAASATQFREALRLAPKLEPAAVEAARGEMMLGRPESALRILEGLEGAAVKPAMKAARLLADMPAGKRISLLIGVNDYGDNAFKLQGAANDVNVLQEALGRLAFDTTRTLLDAEASTDGIRKALRALASEVTARDVIFIHFSGLGFDLDSARTERLITYGERSVQAGSAALSAKPTALSARELHELLLQLQPARVIFNLDANLITSDLHRLAADAGYVFLSAAAPGQMTSESKYDGKTLGHWSYHLAKALKNAESKSAFEIFTEASLAARETRNESHPRLSGPTTLPLFQRDDRLLIQAEVDALGVVSGERLRSLFAATARDSTRAESSVYENLGRALTRRNSFDLAADAFAKDLRTQKSSVTSIDPLIALIGSSRSLEAADALSRTINQKSFTPHVRARLEGLIPGLRKMGTARKKALIVAVANYQTAGLKSPARVLADADSVRHLLISRFEYLPEDITTLVDSSATAARILQEFTRLADHARHQPAFFYFSGLGSSAPSGLTIISADGRGGAIRDISLDSLAAIAPPDSTNLTVVLDAFDGDRMEAEDERELPQTRGLGGATRADFQEHAVGIGHLTVYPTMTFAVGGRGASAKAATPSFTLNLITAVTATSKASVNEIRRAWTAPSSSPVILAAGAARLGGFSPATNLRLVTELRNVVNEEPLRETISLLQRLIEHRGGNAPERWVDLGVAYAAQSEYELAVQAFDKAISLFAAEADRADVRYHLGKTLFESNGDLDRAVAELRQAVKIDSANAGAWLYLGLALRAQIANESEGTVRKALESYMSAGAPLGREVEIEEILEQIRQEARTSTKTR